MKTTFSTTKQRYALSIIAAIFAVSVPMVVRAHDGEDHTNDTTEKKSYSMQTYCKSFDALTAKTATEVKKRGDSAKTEWSKRGGDIKKHRENWINKVNEARKNEDTKRSEAFAKLDALAKTDAQKEAVKSYQEQVLAAVAARRAAHDASREAFFNGINALVAANSTNNANDAAAMRSAVTTAIANAKAACTAGESPEQVRAQLNAALKAARSNYKSEHSGGKSTIKGKIAELNKTRVAANDAANQAFKAAITTAREQLKAAFSDNEI